MPPLPRIRFRGDPVGRDHRASATEDQSRDRRAPCCVHRRRRDRGTRLHHRISALVVEPAIDISDLRVGGPDECWEWMGTRLPKGYGTKRKRGIQGPIYVHRFVFELFHGRPIAPKMTVDHLCRNTSCANPAHLEETTYQENNNRGGSPSALNASKVACPKCGSEYTVQKSGKRRCRPCSVAYSKVYYHAHKSSRA